MCKYLLVWKRFLSKLLVFENVIPRRCTLEQLMINSSCRHFPFHTLFVRCFTQEPNKKCSHTRQARSPGGGGQSARPKSNRKNWHRRLADIRIHTMRYYTYADLGFVAKIFRSASTKMPCSHRSTRCSFASTIASRGRCSLPTQPSPTTSSTIRRGVRVLSLVFSIDCIVIFLQFRSWWMVDRRGGQKRTAKTCLGLMFWP